MDMHNGGAGASGLDAGFGNRGRGDGNMRAFGARVAAAGHRTSDDDFRVHSVQNRRWVSCKDTQPRAICAYSRHFVVAPCTAFGNSMSRMSPTIFREDGFRFYFFSREESRMHLHVECADGEAKFWLEPAVELAANYRLSDQQIRSIRILIEAHVDEFRSAWTKHFSS